ncbi:MAG: lactate utilization protein B [Planctomycetia bacterium]|jgi:L-lactate dehydrogenase complex protein LldF
MSDHEHHGARFYKWKTAGLQEPAGSEALGKATERAAHSAKEVADEIPYFQQWRDAAHEVKRFAVANLDKLLVEFEQKLSARGVKVLWAKDAETANQMVVDIAKEHNVKSVVKSKSMVSEEIDLNKALTYEGIRPVETDLGEYLVQLADQHPTHIVTPALHLSAEDCGHLFEEKLGEPFTKEHQELTAIARKHLRQEFLTAGMGVSGVNFAVADTGTIAIIENEGNAGLSTSTPPIHVALMGIEKVIPSIDYLPLFWNLLGRSGTAQKLTSYTHLIHGCTPGKTMYLIIIDNRRTEILADPPSRMSLGCIRCGNCLNNCPVYRRVGGWAYGWRYPGPIGSILTPHLVGMKQAGKLPFASSLCGACAEACPIKIDIPHQLVHLRHRAVNEPSPAKSVVERIMWTVWAWLFSSAFRYRWTMFGVKFGSKFAKFLPWHPWYMGAWTRGRTIPRAKGPAFRDRWKRRKK